MRRRLGRWQRKRSPGTKATILASSIVGGKPWSDREARRTVLDGHPTLEQAQLVGEAVKKAITGPFRLAHATLELECESCNDDGDCCPMDTAALAAPAAGRGRR